MMQFIYFVGIGVIEYGMAAEERNANWNILTVYCN